MLTALLYLAGVLVALYAIQSRDVTHCVIALLVLFVGGGVYLIALGNEFVGLSLIVIYAGAVAVLFMFVIFTVNLSVEQGVPPAHKAYMRAGAPLVCALFGAEVLGVMFWGLTLGWGSAPGLSFGWGSQLLVYQAFGIGELSGIGFFLYLHSYPILLGLGLLMGLVMLCVSALFLGNRLSGRAE